MKTFVKKIFSEKNEKNIQIVTKSVGFASSQQIKSSLI
jgi:hypothetical protein